MGGSSARIVRNIACGEDESFGSRRARGATPSGAIALARRGCSAAPRDDSSRIWLRRSVPVREELDDGGAELHRAHSGCAWSVREAILISSRMAALIAIAERCGGGRSDAARRAISGRAVPRSPVFSDARDRPWSTRDRHLPHLWSDRTRARPRSPGRAAFPAHSRRASRGRRREPCGHPRRNRGAAPTIAVWRPMTARCSVRLRHDHFARQASDRRRAVRGLFDRQLRQRCESDDRRQCS